MRQILYVITIIAVGVLGPSISFTASSGPQGRADEWRQEFADVCGKTQQAMDLPDTELKEYIERCNRLQERIGDLGGAEDSARRFYSRRLEMCADFYEYMLDFKKQEKMK